MKTAVKSLFFIILLIACSLTTFSQSNADCNGSLGDPVINQDFGSGANPGPQLAAGMTNMQYTTDNCPNDGYYTIAHSLTGTGNCHPDTWQNVLTDHTGNPNGYMMIVNAYITPNVFFTQPANGLCPNTHYYFSAWILNLILKEPNTDNFSEPNITFSIETTTGSILAEQNTGVIDRTNSPTWVQFGVPFTTPPNVTDVVVKMTNNAPGGNGNDLILDDITFRACGPIIEEGFSSYTGQKNMSLCQGGSATFTLQANVIGNGTPVLQWQKSVDSSAWTDVPGATTASLAVPFINAQAGSYQYRLGVANGSSITDAACRVYSEPLTVTVNPLPVVPGIAAQTICQGGTLELTATSGASYRWTGPGISPTTQNPLVVPNVTAANSGAYSVVAVSDAGCAARAVTANVTVIPKVTASVNSPAFSVCAGQSVQLSASGGAYYKWTPSIGLDHDNIANPVATPLQTTKYTVDVSNGSCDDTTQSVTVTVNQNPIADAGNEIKLFQGQSARLQGTVKGDSITGYYWTPATGLSDPNVLNPITTPTDDITYTLTAVSKSCGMSTSSVFVRVYKKITIPNTFTPNHDGVNDFWSIDALVTYPESFTQVFDRYGQPVFQSNGYPKPWDGTENGKPLPAGTYYYVIDLKNGTPKISGWVLLVR